MRNYIKTRFFLYDFILYCILLPCNAINGQSANPNARNEMARSNDTFHHDRPTHYVDSAPQTR